jgi:hypothetical protein
MAVAEGAPAEKRCTFLCDKLVGADLVPDDAKLAECEALGGECVAGIGRMKCGPTL